VACALLILPQAAHAYVGPGLGLGAIAVVIGVIGSVLLAVFALFWYPIKRMFKKNKPEAKDASPPNPSE
jgi:hypothetical protein